jgi:hypothetical protein
MSDTNSQATNSPSTAEMILSSGTLIRVRGIPVELTDDTIVRTNSENLDLIEALLESEDVETNGPNVSAKSHEEAELTPEHSVQSTFGFLNTERVFVFQCVKIINNPGTSNQVVPNGELVAIRESDLNGIIGRIDADTTGAPVYIPSINRHVSASLDTIIDLLGERINVF